MSDEQDVPEPPVVPTRRRADHAEHGLSHWVDRFLDRAILGNHWHTAIEGGTWLHGATEEARMNAENKRRARGIKPSHLDLYAWQESSGKYAQWELKVYGRPVRKGQLQTMVALRRQNIPTGVCETVVEVFYLLRDAGFDLHGNAENIAIEFHERYLAARRAAPTKKAARARKPEPRASAGFTIARAHRMGFWKG